MRRAKIRLAWELTSMHVGAMNLHRSDGKTHGDEPADGKPATPIARFCPSLSESQLQICADLHFAPRLVQLQRSTSEHSVAAGGDISVALRAPRRTFDRVAAASLAACHGRSNKASIPFRLLPCRFLKDASERISEADSWRTEGGWAPATGDGKRARAEGEDTPARKTPRGGTHHTLVATLPSFLPSASACSTNNSKKKECAAKKARQKGKKEGPKNRGKKGHTTPDRA
jgi:hypothetical protein